MPRNADLIKRLLIKLIWYKRLIGFIRSLNFPPKASTGISAMRRLHLAIFPILPRYLPRRSPTRQFQYQVPPNRTEIL